MALPSAYAKPAGRSGAGSWRKRSSISVRDRAGTAAAWIGPALDIKPILTIESELKAVERVRTRRGGVERLIEVLRQRRSLGADRWFVHHVHAPVDAQMLVDRVDAPPEFVSEPGPVIGAHIGPGALLFGGLPGAALR
jgi:fatty acid-binding protein DegV